MLAGTFSTYFNSCNSHNNPLRQVWLWPLLFYSWGNWDTGKWDNLTKVMNLKDRGAGYTCIQSSLAMDTKLMTTTLHRHFDLMPPMPTRPLFPYDVLSSHPFLKSGYRFHPSSSDLFLHLAWWWGGNCLKPSVLCKLVGIYSINRLWKEKGLQLSPRLAKMWVYPGYWVACYLNPPTTNTRARAPTKPNILLAKYWSDRGVLDVPK